MSTIRNPVGPQPPGIYWRRRAVVLIGLVAIIVVVLLIVFRPSGTPTSPASSSKPSNTSTSALTDDAEACDPTTIELTAVTDKGGYDQGVTPMISMSITNTGTEPCTINGGTDAQEYIITSGSDQIWSSRDCQADPAPAETVLQPAVPRSTAPFPWDRTRSTPETCEGERPQVGAGGASYHLTVKLGDIESAATKQFLLF